MGICFSKKKPKPYSSSSTHQNPLASASLAATAVSPAAQPSAVVVPLDPATSKPKKEKQEQQREVERDDAPTQVKKEVFLIKHRRSHDDKERNSKPLPISNPIAAAEEDESEPVAAAAAEKGVVRTSSCTKEEVDAILIQCGRLSRSSSGKAASSSASIERGGGRRYSGSKRSYDFDHCGGDARGGEDSGKNEIGAAAEDVTERRSGERHGRHRRSSRGSPSPQGRRRTPSREREQGQRSSSRERRVSRSPGRRAPEAGEPAAPASVSGGAANRPGKMVSVPATVSALVMDRSNNGEPASGAVIKRISVKRNVGEGGSRSAASPRSQSPARVTAGGNAKPSSESQQQPSLSRNSSRKAEQSPYRRNPLSEIDPNSLAYPQPHNSSSNRSQSRGKRETEGDEIIAKESNQTQKPNPGNNHRTGARVSTDNKSPIVNLNSSQQQATVETTVVIAGSDAKPQAVTRSRSGRRSRDFDFTPEALLNPNPTPSYTRLLLEDIQNFHQKSTSIVGNAVSLPPCVSKACSILEAVADLNNNSNSTASSNLSCAFPEDHHLYYSKGSNNGVARDPFVESEVVGSDDLMEPSFHKYVTVRRGTGGVAADDQESSGSNSFAGSSTQLNHWGGLSSSSWEPNSADSTDRWTSRSGSREDDKLSGVRKRETHGGGIGRGRLGSAKGLYTTAPVVAAAGST